MPLLEALTLQFGPAIAKSILFETEYRRAVVRRLDELELR